MKTFLKILAGVILTVFIVVFAFSATLYLKPEWIFEPKILQWILQKNVKDYQFTWSNLSVSSENETFLNKRLLVRADRFCFKKMNQPNKLFCINNTESNLSFHFSFIQLPEIRNWNLLTTMPFEKFALKADLQSHGSFRKIHSKGNLYFIHKNNLNTPKLPISFQLYPLQKHIRHFSFYFENFQELVRYLKNTPFEIPAPINSLNGRVELKIDNFDFKQKKPPLDFEAKLDLQGPSQKLASTAKGKLSEDEETKAYLLTLDADFSDLEIQLPSVDLKQISQFKMDKRILSDEDFHRQKIQPLSTLDFGVEKKIASKLQYQIHITSLKAAKIHSSLSSSPIPIDFEVHLDSKLGTSADVQIKSFRTKVFKQFATIDYLNIRKEPTSNLSPIDGVIRFAVSGVTVRVLVSGTTSQPHMSFESEPPLTNQQVVALLLFGKYPDDLDSDQFASAANMTSALSQGAFGLASFFFFASTPIEYVGFDPVAQSYAVRVKIAKGTSVEFGSTLNENEHLTLRRRLAPHWQLSTEIRREFESNANAVSTFIEWFKRF